MIGDYFEKLNVSTAVSKSRGYIKDSEEGRDTNW